MCSPSFRLARPLVLLALTVCSATAQAQNPVVQGSLLYYTDSAAINSDISGNDVVLGKAPGGLFAHSDGDTDILNGYILTLQPGSIVTNNAVADGYMGVHLFNYATLQVTGGTVASITARNNSSAYITSATNTRAYGYDSSTINVYNGTFTSIENFHNSTVNISGGRVVDAAGRDNAIVNIQDGQHGTLTGYNASRFSVAGGTVFRLDNGGNGSSTVTGGFLARVDARENRVVDLKGGRSDSAFAYGNGEIRITGGTTAYSYTGQNGTTLISGGTVGQANLIDAYETANLIISGGDIASGSGGKIRKFGGTLDLYGSNLTLSGPIGVGSEGRLGPGPDTGTYYTLTGTLLDGSPLNTTLFLGTGQSFMGRLGGGTQNEYILPVPYNRFTNAFPNVPSRVWVGAPFSETYVFTMTDGSFFTEILSLPVGTADADGLFTVHVGGVYLGEFAQGARINFSSAGFTDVSQFTISGIEWTPSVDAPPVGDAPPVFPVQLAFSQPFASFTMTSVAAPEPGSLLLLALGGLGWALRTSRIRCGSRQSRTDANLSC